MSGRQQLPHPHLVARRAGRRAECGGVRRRTDPLGMSPMFRSFIAGQLATIRELTLFYAPNINSYKRFVEGSFAPTAVAWGWTTAPARCGWSATVTRMRMELRAPGGDVNQYLAVAALVAGGLHGIEKGLELGEACAGNAYTAGATPSDHAGRGRRVVRQVGGGPGGVRRRGRGPLSEQRRVELAAFNPRSPTGRGCVALSASAAKTDVPERPARRGPDHPSAAGPIRVWDVHASFLPGIYLDGVTLAGGSPRCCRRSRSTPTSPPG